MSWILIIKSVLSILSLVIGAVRDGSIKEGSYDEVVNVILREHRKKIDKAADARADVESGRVPIDPKDPFLRP